MATRADNNEGSCREVLRGRHKGKWRVQYIQTDEFNRKRRLSRLFETKTLARAFLKDLRHGTRLENARQSKALTLGTWFDWLALNDWPDQLDLRTVQARVARFDKYVRPLWGEVPLTRIDPLAVRIFYRKLKDEGVGAATVLEIKRNLVRVFNQAVSPYGRVPMTCANPFRLHVEAPKPRAAVALTPEDARQAIASKRLDPERRAMLGLLLLGGVRLGEQMAMTVDQVILDQDLIFIDKAAKLGHKGNQTVDLPKGRRKRLLVACPSLTRLLEPLVVNRPGDKVIWSASTENKARMKKLVYATWRTIVRDAGLPPEMTPHDCRLTHINWIEKLMPEVSPTTWKEHAGHAAVGVSEIHYTRPITSAQKILRDAIERVYGA